MCYFLLTKFLHGRLLQTTTYWECISIKLSNFYKYFLRYPQCQLTKHAILLFWGDLHFKVFGMGAVRNFCMGASRRKAPHMEKKVGKRPLKW